MPQQECVPQHQRFHSASRQVEMLPSGIRGPRVVGPLSSSRWPVALLTSYPFGSDCTLSKKEKKKTEKEVTLKLGESFNPSEVSPVEIIITEGYLVEYSCKWWKTAA